MEKIKLNDGGQMPGIGFGTWQLAEGRETVEAVLAALDAGYRLIDTAKIYGNEAGTGEGVRRSGLVRKDLFMTTKLWPSDFGSRNTRRALEESLARLELDYLDLYLLHWPGREPRLRRESWQELEKAKTDGLVRHIGVSNFMPEHLEEMAGYAKQSPAVNQIEFNPFVFSEQAAAWQASRAANIAVEAYSPLARAHNMRNQTLQKLAESHSKTSAQIMLRWAIQHKTIPIPKSAHAGRIKENIDVFNFELSRADMDSLDQLSGRGGFG
jgi:methylglyoxal/glyoxal reductase